MYACDSAIEGESIQSFHNKELKNLCKSAAISASTRPGPLRDFRQHTCDENGDGDDDSGAHSSLILPQTRPESVIFPSLESGTGSIRPGMEADLIVLDHSPLDDINSVRDVLLVVNDGKIAVNHLKF